MIRYLVALGLALVPAAATAQQRQPVPVPAPRGEEWTHGLSGVRVPARVSGLERGEVQDSTGVGLDLTMHYRDANTTLSLYIYRPTVAVPSLWFDQSIATLATNPAIAADLRTLRPRDVAAGGEAGRAGRMISFAVNRGGYRSTGLTLVPAGEWLVKLRASSRTLDQRGIEELMQRALADIRFTVGAAGPALRQIDGCSQRVTSSATAREARPNPELMRRVTGELLTSFQQYRAQPFCREAQEGYVGLYHGSDQRDGYFIAIGDSGRVARVRRLGAEAQSLFVAEYFDLDAGYVAGFFESLPAPAQVIEAAGRAMQSGGLGRVSLGTSPVERGSQGVPTT